MENNKKLLIHRAVISTVLACAISAHAQTPVEPYGPGSDRLSEPEFKSADEPEFVLPKISPPGSDQDLKTALRLFVKNFEFSGNEAIPSHEIEAITAPYENRQLTTAEIQEVRQKITLYYIDKGFINSGALLPDQKVKDGIIKLVIIEGELTDIEVDGNDGIDADYVSDRLRLGSGPPLNIKVMQERLRIVQQDPLIKKVNATLLPGTHPGESILKVLVEENKPYSVVIFANNYRSPSIGGLGYGIEAVHRNLTGVGDTISYRGVQSKGPVNPGINENALSYIYPLNEYDTKVRLFYSGSETRVVEDPFSELNIRSESDNYGIELTHPVFKTVDSDVILGIGFEKKKSQSYLESEPFPFTLGTEDGESRLTIMRLTQRFSKRTQNEALSFRSVFSFGLDAFDATIHDDAGVLENCGNVQQDECPDGNFSAWLGQLQYARRISLDDRQISFIFRADAQLTSDSLLPAEQFSVGGARTVRGYREGQLVRDNGFIASVELRIPVFLDELGASNVQLIPFIDYGRSWNEIRSTPEPSTLSSAGLGISWRPDRQLAMELFAAKNFHPIVGESDNYDPQDDGLHFQVSYSF